MLPRGAVLATCCCCSLATSNSGDCCRRTKSFPQLFCCFFFYFLFLVWWAVEFVVVAKQMAFYFISHISAPSCFVCLRRSELLLLAGVVFALVIEVETPLKPPLYPLCSPPLPLPPFTSPKSRPLSMHITLNADVYDVVYYDQRQVK